MLKTIRIRKAVVQVVGDVLDENGQIVGEYVSPAVNYYPAHECYPASAVQMLQNQINDELRQENG